MKTGMRSYSISHRVGSKKERKLGVEGNWGPSVDNSITTIFEGPEKCHVR